MITRPLDNRAPGHQTLITRPLVNRAPEASSDSALTQHTVVQACVIIITIMIIIMIIIMGT